VSTVPSANIGEATNDRMYAALVSIPAIRVWSSASHMARIAQARVSACTTSLPRSGS
jgi:hypothetical protein